MRWSTDEKNGNIWSVKTASVSVFCMNTGFRMQTDMIAIVSLVSIVSVFVGEELGIEDSCGILERSGQHHVC